MSQKPPLHLAASFPSLDILSATLTEHVAAFLYTLVRTSAAPFPQNRLWRAGVDGEEEPEKGEAGRRSAFGDCAPGARCHFVRLAVFSVSAGDMVAFRMAAICGESQMLTALCTPRCTRRPRYGSRRLAAEVTRPGAELDSSLGCGGPKPVFRRPPLSSRARAE